MPIYLKEPVETYSDASFDASVEPIVMESDAFRVLYAEMLRYSRGEINGRSFLIAGHRGAGKTTMVESAVLALRDYWRDQQVPLRPLLVPLNGPSMLRSEAAEDLSAIPRDDDSVEGDESAADGDGEPEKGAAGAPNGRDEKRRQDENESALTQVLLSLYRVAAHEFVQTYRRETSEKGDFYGGELRERVRPPLWLKAFFWLTLEKAPAYRLQRRRRDDRQRELFELACQLELELDDYPGPMRLRHFWERGGFLDTGVLFPQGQRRDAARSTKRSPRLFRNGQGYRELVALISLCRAHQRISGEITGKRKNQKTAGKGEKSEGGLNLKGVELMKPLTALLAGGVAGTGAYQIGGSPLLGTFTGLAAALAAAFTLSLSWSRERTHQLTEQLTFLPDLSLATLGRALPLLVQRLRDAGLVPIFMIDELDKIEEPEKRLGNLVRNLKKLVAESAFFCFLTDRNYFEYLNLTNRKTPYPPEYTYFSRQLFVSFSVENFHRYLQKIVVHQPKTGSPLAEPGGSGDGASEQAEARKKTDPQAEQEAAEERIDAVVLPYLLLHQARMHPIDLNRALDRFRGEDGRLKKEPGYVRSHPGFRFDIGLQLGVESILRRKAVRNMLDRDPDFRRYVHDALYYLPRLWREGAGEIDLSERGREPFEKYLENRMQARPENGQKPRLSEDRMDKLFKLVRDLAMYCADWNLLRLSLEDDFFRDKSSRSSRENDRLSKEEKRILIGVVPEQTTLLLEPVEPDRAAAEQGARPWACVYRWMSDYNGLERPLADQEPTPEADSVGEDVESQFQRDAESARGMAEALSTAVGDRVNLVALATELGLLGTTPSWLEVNRILDRAAQELNPEQKEVDARILREYMGMLSAHADGLALGFQSAGIVSAAVPGDFGTRVLAGLKTLAERHALPALGAGDKLKALQRQWRALVQWEPELDNPVFETPAVEDPPNFSTWQSYLTRLRRFCDELEKATPRIYQKIHDAAGWARWFWRMDRFMRENALVHQESLEDVFFYTRHRGLSDRLKLDLNAMSVGDWSDLLTASVCAKGDAPAWLHVPALFGLFFGSERILAFLDFDEQAVNGETYRSDSGEEVASGAHWRPLFEGFAQPAVRPVALLTLSPQNEARLWPPWNGCPLLALDLDSANDLAFHSWPRQPGPADLLKFVAICCETPVNGWSPEQEERIRELHNRLAPRQNAPLVRVYPRLPQPAPTEPYIVAPTHQQDLFEKLTAIGVL